MLLAPTFQPERHIYLKREEIGKLNLKWVFCYFRRSISKLRFGYLFARCEKIWRVCRRPGWNIWTNHISVNFTDSTLRFAQHCCPYWFYDLRNTWKFAPDDPKFIFIRIRWLRWDDAAHSAQHRTKMWINLKFRIIIFSPSHSDSPCSTRPEINCSSLRGRCDDFNGADCRVNAVCRENIHRRRWTIANWRKLIFIGINTAMHHTNRNSQCKMHISFFFLQFCALFRWHFLPHLSHSFDKHVLAKQKIRGNIVGIAIEWTRPAIVGWSNWKAWQIGK